MSWVGKQAQKDLMACIGWNIEVETTRAVTKLLHYGVEHCDVRPPNVLWHPESRKVMLVDFERSEILKRLPILREISPNLKRKRLHSNEGTSCTGASHKLVVGATSGRT